MRAQSRRGNEHNAVGNFRVRFLGRFYQPGPARGCGNYDSDPAWLSEQGPACEERAECELAGWAAQIS